MSAKTETPTDTKLRLSRIFSAPRHKVFRAWTDPVHLKNWFHAGTAYATIIAEVDLRVGGIYRLGMRHIESGKEHITSGVFQEIIPNEKLVYSWQWEKDRADEGETLVTIEFNQRNGTTEVILTHEGFRDAELRDDHIGGWTGALEAFSTAVSELLSSDKIELSVFVKAPVEKVYQYLTDEKLLIKWFLSKAETDPRVGGKYNFCWEFTDIPSRNHQRTGKFLELIPHNKIRYSWDAFSKQDSLKNTDSSFDATMVEFNLIPEKGGTQVFLTHTGWGKNEVERKNYDSHYGGWSYFMENLKSWLEQNIDTRHEAMNMVTR